MRASGEGSGGLFPLWGVRGGRRERKQEREPEKGGEEEGGVRWRVCRERQNKEGKKQSASEREKETEAQKGRVRKKSMEGRDKGAGQKGQGADTQTAEIVGSGQDCVWL